MARVIGSSIDTDLNEFKEVDKPHNFIDFDTEIGQQMWSECHITECPKYLGICFGRF